MFLKQSTAKTVKIGPIVDSADASAETSLTISQADIRISKNGGDFAQTNNSAGATHDEAGYYDVPLDTTDTNTVGMLRVAIGESGTLGIFRDFWVLPNHAWYLFGDTGYVYPAPTAPVRVGDFSVTALAVLTSLYDALGADINANTTQLLTGIYAGSLPPNPTLTAPVVIRAGDTFTQNFVIGDITGNTEIHFMIKPSTATADTAATVHISKTGGLEYIDGEAAGTSANGSITVNDASTGDITVFLDETETIKLQDNATSTSLVGIKAIYAAKAETEATGTATINPAIVQAVS